jgi:D-amino-acid oxidase
MPKGSLTTPRRAACHVCVVGAGIVGLSTALELTRQIKHCRVTVCGEASKKETTSYGAGGFWEPYNVKGTPEWKVNAWGRYSFEHFEECERRGVPGVQSVRAYNLFHPKAPQPDKLPFWKDVVHNFHEITPEERDVLKTKLGGLVKLAKSGCYSFTTMVADQRFYLPWLTEELKNTGRVTFIELPQKLEALEHIRHVVPQASLICNCSGLGSYFMNDIRDDKLVPVRGQVVRVIKPPASVYENIAFTYEDEASLVYVLPNHDTVVLGGTAERGEFDLTVDGSVSKLILDNAVNFLPELGKAQVQDVWVGRRPTRSPLRMELEYGFGSLPPVVHLYGHGGCGVTIGLGSAHDAVKNLICPLLCRNHRSSI